MVWLSGAGSACSAPAGGAAGFRRSRPETDQQAMAQTPTTQVPPQNIEVEQSVLGAMLVAQAALTRVIDEVKLKPEDFYLDKHQEIFGAIHDLYAASKPVDELSVVESLDPARPDRGGRRQALRLRAGRQGPGGRQRQALRRDRPAELPASAVARSGTGDPVLGARARWGAALAGRARREAALRGRPRGAGERFPPRRRDPDRRARPAREALQRRRRGDRDALGLP